MLVLTRKVGEEIRIGNETEGESRIVLRVLSIQGGRVRIGIEADSSIPIYRRELVSDDIPTDFHGYAFS